MDQVKIFNSPIPFEISCFRHDYCIMKTKFSKFKNCIFSQTKFCKPQDKNILKFVNSSKSLQNLNPTYPF